MRNVTSPAHPVFDANRPWSVRRPRVRRARSVSVHRSIHVAAYASLLAFCYSATSYALPLQQPAMALGALILLTEIVLGRHSLVLGGRPGLFLLLYSLAVAASVPLSISFGTSFADGPPVNVAGRAVHKQLCHSIGSLPARSRNHRAT